MSDRSRGQWIIVVRDIPANQDTYLGPFHSEDKAAFFAERLNGDFATHAAEDVMEAVVRWVQPGVEFEDLRDELLVSLEASGFEFVARSGR